MVGVYLITDDTSTPDELLRRVREALTTGVRTIQLRRKRDDARDVVKLGFALREMTSAFGAFLIVNDRVDIALLIEADGVHVGQRDLSSRQVRQLLADKIVGVSAATVEEAVSAVHDGADYLGVGAIYQTQTKTDARVCGIAGLKSIRKAVAAPIVAIGGIQEENAGDVFAAEADGVAVVSAIMQAQSVTRATRQLLSLSNYSI